MSTEQPSTIAGFATNIDKFNLPSDFYETYLQNFKVLLWTMLRESLVSIIRDNLRVMVAGKGQDILASLEEMPYDIRLSTKMPSLLKPDFSTPTDNS